MRRAAVSLALFALAACGERAAPVDDRTAPDLRRPETGVVGGAVPVRIGEAGPAFRACNAAGTPRAEPLVVRAGPFENAAVTGSVVQPARVFVCTRSIDQHWMGIVYAPGGALSSECGVSVPVPAQANYSGACLSGWVTSATVRTVAD